MSTDQEKMIEIKDQLEKIITLIDQIESDVHLFKVNEILSSPIIEYNDRVVQWMMLIIFITCLVSGMVADKGNAIGYSIIFCALFIMNRSYNA